MIDNSTWKNNIQMTVCPRAYLQLRDNSDNIIVNSGEIISATFDNELSPINETLQKNNLDIVIKKTNNHSFTENEMVKVYLKYENEENYTFIGRYFFDNIDIPEYESQKTIHLTNLMTLLSKYNCKVWKPSFYGTYVSDYYTEINNQIYDLIGLRPLGSDTPLYSISYKKNIEKDYKITDVLQMLFLARGNLLYETITDNNKIGYGDTYYEEQTINKRIQLKDVTIEKVEKMNACACNEDYISFNGLGAYDFEIYPPHIKSLTVSGSNYIVVVKNKNSILLQLDYEYYDANNNKVSGHTDMSANSETSFTIPIVNINGNKFLCGFLDDNKGIYTGATLSTTTFQYNSNYTIVKNVLTISRKLSTYNFENYLSNYKKINSYYGSSIYTFPKYNVDINNYSNIFIPEYVYKFTNIDNGNVYDYDISFDSSSETAIMTPISVQGDISNAYYELYTPNYPGNEFSITHNVVCSYYDETTSQIIDVYNDFSEIDRYQSVTNPFTNGEAISMSHFILNYIMNDTKYLIEMRTNPTLEVGDSVYIELKDGTTVRCKIISINTTFNGSMKSTVKLVKL